VGSKKSPGSHIGHVVFLFPLPLQGDVEPPQVIYWEYPGVFPVKDDLVAFPFPFSFLFFFLWSGNIPCSRDASLTLLSQLRPPSFPELPCLTPFAPLNNPILKRLSFIQRRFFFPRRIFLVDGFFQL